MTKERIEIVKQSLIPFVQKELLKIDYEGLGKSDAEKFKKDLNEILDLAIKALEQQPSEDCVSRAEVIDELNRLGRNSFKDDTEYDNFFAFVDTLLPVTPANGTSDDCVDRNHVIATISHHHFDKDKDNFDLLVHNLCKEVKALPPVTPTHGTCKDCNHFHNVRKDFNICDLWTIACADNHYCADYEKRGSTVGWSNLENVREKVERGDENEIN